MKKRLIKQGLAAMLASSCAWVYAQTALPPVKDVPATIGKASRTAGPFF